MSKPKSDSPRPATGGETTRRDTRAAVHDAAPSAAHDSDLAAARDALLAESKAIARLADCLDGHAFGRAVDRILACKAQTILTGMGKSGHIAAKIAATLASTGTPAFFMHPAEALHGDLGMLTAHNVIVALSQSGSTEEVVSLIPYIKRLGIPLVALTGNRNSPLAKNADVVLPTEVDHEACPLNLAPTTSTTLQLALGDALAVALMKRRGFTPEDFAMRHPLGALGRRLLVHVSDLMHTGEENPIVADTATLRDAILQISSKRLGAVSVIGPDGRLVGILCDGDVRRLLQSTAGILDMNLPVRDYMIHNPRRTSPDTLGVKAVDLMETHKITVLPVLDDDQRPAGMIHLHDLIRAGITP